MSTALTKERVLEALKKYNGEPFHILHALTVGGVMRRLAQDQGCGEGTDFWGTTGLLYDIDFEIHPEQHCVKAPEFLREAGVEDEPIHAVCSRGYSLVSDVKPEHQMEKILFVSDKLTGLIGTAARTCLSGSVMDMEVSSPRKEFKGKCSAAGCSRDIVREGTEELGWTPGELMDETIRAMRSYEAVVSEEMKLYEV